MAYTIIITTLTLCILNLILAACKPVDPFDGL